MGRRRKSATYDSEEGKGYMGKTFVRSDALRSNTANERERARMRVLSKAFVRLKTSLPWVPPDTKLSKLDTLRLASRYIAHLRRQLDVGAEGTDGGATEARNQTIADKDGGHFRSVSSDCDRMLRSDDIHPINLSWPFTSNLRKSSFQIQLSSLGTRSTDPGTTTSTITPTPSSSSSLSSSSPTATTTATARLVTSPTMS